MGAQCKMCAYLPGLSMYRVLLAMLVNVRPACVRWAQQKERSKVTVVTVRSSVRFLHVCVRPCKAMVYGCSCISRTLVW
jgi:hypothetical protein